MRRLIAIATLGTVLMGADDCDPPPPPKVVAFTVEPTVVCPGDSVTVTWDLDHGVPLLYSSATVDPAQVIQGDWSQLTLEDGQGTKTFVITENTSFKAASFANADSVDTSDGIHVSLAQSGVQLATFPPCVGSVLWGSWAPDAATTATTVLAKTIVNESPLFPPTSLVKPTMSVTHAGQTFELGPTSQPAPSGLPFTGTWKASIALPNGYGCPSFDSVSGGNVPLIPPPALSAKISYGCP